ncbi:MAG: transglutaminase-like domain-containing protein [Blastocatellia bacterium]
MNKAEARRQFTELVMKAENEIEPGRAALLIAAEEYPSLDPDTYLAQLDQFAAEVRAVLPSQTDPLIILLTLNDHLFNQLGFHGNTENYYDARNSFLNDVIDRRTGIPITLSVIYLEVARRLGLPVYGVGLPGHFLVRYRDAERDVIIDPFHAGRVLSVERCQEMFEEMYGGTVKFQLSFLSEVTTKQMLTRMLHNLKGIYLRVPDYARALGVIERLLILQPESPVEIRDRGLASLALGRYTQAQADLESYLRRVPLGEDVDDIKEKLTELRRKQARLN